MKPESISNPDKQTEILRKLKSIRFYSTNRCSYWIYGVNSFVVAVAYLIGIALSDPANIIAANSPIYQPIRTTNEATQFIVSTAILLSYLPR